MNNFSQGKNRPSGEWTVFLLKNQVVGWLVKVFVDESSKLNTSQSPKSPMETFNQQVWSMKQYINIDYFTNLDVPEIRPSVGKLPYYPTIFQRFHVTPLGAFRQRLWNAP